MAYKNTEFIDFLSKRPKTSKYQSQIQLLNTAFLCTK